MANWRFRFASGQLSTLAQPRARLARLGSACWRRRSEARPRAWSTNSHALQKYIAAFPDQPQVVIAHNPDASRVQAALDQALSAVRAHSGARISLIRAHVIPTESAAWSAALQADHLTLRQVDSAGLSVIIPGS